MATLTSAQQVFMFLWIIGSVAAGDLKAKPGEDVTLQCHSPTDAAVTKLVWKRSDLENVNVFFFRDGSPSETNQDPRYRGRVELKDTAVKNEDASFVLKNVTIKDTGTYQCRVTNSNIPGETELLRCVHLSVSEGPEKEIKNDLLLLAIDEPRGPSCPSMEELKGQIHKLKVGLGVSLGLVCPLVGVACFALGRFVFPKSKSGPL